MELPDLLSGGTPGAGFRHALVDIHEGRLRETRSGPACAMRHTVSVMSELPVPQCFADGGWRNDVLRAQSPTVY